MQEHFRKRLRAERLRLKLSRAEAADKIGVSRQSYTQLETVTDDPRLSTLVRLVEAGFRIDALMPELTATLRGPRTG
jgi:transcriptional regulator with XRE-family HTH domain